MQKCVVRWVLRGLAVLTIVGMAARLSEAAPIHPELSLSDLTLSFDGVDLVASTTGLTSVLEWTDAAGNLVGIALGEALLNTGTGVFYVRHEPLGGGLEDLLSGTYLPGTLETSLGAPGASFLATVSVTLSNLPEFAVGDYTVALASLNFANGTGTGQGDIFADVPEPASLSLLLTGLILAGVRRRFRLRA